MGTMRKIASPRDLQAELRSLMAFVHGHGPEGKPNRQVVAAKLQELANRVASRPSVDSLMDYMVNSLEHTSSDAEAVSELVGMGLPQQKAKALLKEWRRQRLHLESDMDEQQDKGEELIERLL